MKRVWNDRFVKSKEGESQREETQLLSWRKIWITDCLSLGFWVCILLLYHTTWMPVSVCVIVSLSVKRVEERIVGFLSWEKGREVFFCKRKERRIEKISSKKLKGIENLALENKIRAIFANHYSMKEQEGRITKNFLSIPSSLLLLLSFLFSFSSLSSLLYYLLFTTS